MGRNGVGSELTRKRFEIANKENLEFLTGTTFVGNQTGEKYLESEAKRRGLNVITLRFRNGLNIWGALEIFNISIFVEVTGKMHYRGSTKKY